MGKIYLVSLESVPSRYTHYWANHLPKMLKEHVGCEVVDVAGSASEIEATPGAFLNFSATNIFKSYQAIHIAELFSQNMIEPGSVFLFTDAWNPTILMVRYMIDLLDVDAKIASIWHAGSYDPADFLGRKVKNKGWSYNAERAYFFASDVNFFATLFHIDLFCDELGIPKDHESIVRTGFPMEYIDDLTYVSKKKKMVCFPHRVSEEKRYELFLEVAARLPEYQFVVCQEQNLSKDEYYQVLSESAIVFSASLQETLGIGVYEGMKSGAWPMVPNRLSYEEMYPLAFFYDDSTVESVIEEIKCIMKMIESSEDDAVGEVLRFSNQVRKHYFVGTKMYNTLKGMMQ